MIQKSEQQTDITDSYVSHNALGESFIRGKQHHLSDLKAEDFLTLDVEHGGGRSGLSLLDPPQPPQHLHRLGGADGSTGEVEGYVGERRHVLRLLDKVRDTCRRQAAKS